MIAPRREIDAFLDSLAEVPPNAVTACAGWTAHELVAHLVSGVEAIASQAEAHLDGRAIPEFGSFAEREVGFWGIDDDELRRRLEDGERRMTEGLHAVRRAAATRRSPGSGGGWRSTTSSCTCARSSPCTVGTSSATTTPVTSCSPVPSCSITPCASSPTRCCASAGRETPGRRTVLDSHPRCRAA